MTIIEFKKRAIEQQKDLNSLLRQAVDLRKMHSTSNETKTYSNLNELISRKIACILLEKKLIGVDFSSADFTLPKLWISS